VSFILSSLAIFFSFPSSLPLYLLGEQAKGKLIKPTHQDEVARGDNNAEKPEAPEGAVNDESLGGEGREGGRIKLKMRQEV